MENPFPDRDLGPQLQHWPDAGKELDIGSRHMHETDDFFNAAGMSTSGTPIGDFQFVRGDTLGSLRPASVI